MSGTLETLRAVLMADAGVTAQIETRLSAGKLPQNVEFPAAVFSVVTAVPQLSFTGSTATRLQYNRVQVDVYAQTYLEARVAFDAIDVVISDLPYAEKEDEREGYEDDTELHRLSGDYAVWL